MGVFLAAFVFTRCLLCVCCCQCLKFYRRTFSALKFTVTCVILSWRLPGERVILTRLTQSVFVFCLFVLFVCCCFLFCFYLRMSLILCASVIFRFEDCPTSVTEKDIPPPTTTTRQIYAKADHYKAQIFKSRKPSFVTLVAPWNAWN